jgi:hypothetical protein
MKTIWNILMAAALFLLCAFVTLFTGNVMAGVASMPVAAAGFELITGQPLFELQTSALFASPLIGLKRKVQNPEFGGIKRIYIIETEHLTSEFLNFQVALSAGKFAGAIPLAAGKKFVEIEAWYDTTKIDGEMKPGGGFTQGLEFEVLGYSADIVKLQALLYENPVNCIVTGNDDERFYLGQKYVPLMFETVMTVPVKGTERKKVTFRAKNDGFTCPVMPLDTTVTFDVTPLVP